MERIPRRDHSAWARKAGKPAWASRSNSPIQMLICSILCGCAPPQFWAAKLGLLVRMLSRAWLSERSRAEPQESSSPVPTCQQFYGLGARGTTPLGPEYLESEPGPPETAPQYRASFEIGPILGRCAPSPFWAAKLGLRARLLSRAWFSERSRAEPQESSSPSPSGQ